MKSILVMKDALLKETLTLSVGWFYTLIVMKNKNFFYASCSFHSFAIAFMKESASLIEASISLMRIATSDSTDASSVWSDAIA